MEEYIDHIEKFLKGQMSLEEECTFKSSLMTDAHLHSYALCFMWFYVIMLAGVMRLVLFMFRLLCPVLELDVWDMVEVLKV